MLKTVRDGFPIPWVIPWATGRWYGNPSGGTLSTGAITSATVYAVPIFVPNSAGVTATSIGVEFTVAGTAGHTARFAIYEDENGYPGDLIVDGGSVAADPGGVPAFQSATISQYLRQGWYWTSGIIQTGTVRTTISNSHFSLMSRDGEGSVANNPNGITATPAALTVTLWLGTGMPEVFPSIYGITTGPVHGVTPRIMIGI